MTLVAFATHPDRAEIMTDTIGYTRSSRHVTFGHRKATPIPGHAAAITSVGSTFFAETFRQVLNRLAGDVDTFDQLVEHATNLAPDLWRHVDADITSSGRTSGLDDTEVYLIGYSERLDRFRAVCLPSYTGLEPVDVSGVHIRPTPMHLRPSAVEAHRLADTIERSAWPQLQPSSHARLADMATNSEPTPPADRGEWITLARQVRASRAVEPPLQTGFKVYVAGDVELTTITRTAVDVDVIHRFDDHGDEWRQMLALSLHPDSQLAPCPCGSGTRYVHCCLAYGADDVCPCGSGDRFVDCCRVAGPADIDRAAWIGDQLPNILEMCAHAAADWLAGHHHLTPETTGATS